MAIIKLRRKQNIYFVSSWVVILIGLFVFYYFMNHVVPEGNKEFVIAIVGGFAGVMLLAGYKVIGKNQALDEIEELKEDLKDWKHRHDACEQKYTTLDKQVNALTKMILEHLNKK